MKRSFYLFTTLILTITFWGCSGSGKLTNEKAQQAVTQWLASIEDNTATATVTGVLEVPQENSAKADVNLSNFVWHSPKNDPITAYAFGPGGEAHTYSGRADAIFIHYNDGRWVLSKIVTPIGSWGDLQVEASTGAPPSSEPTVSASAAQSNRSLFHKITDWLRLTTPPPQQYGVYAFDNGKYIELSRSVPDAERRNFSSSLKIFVHEDPSNISTTASPSIVKLSFLRFVIHGEDDPRGFWVLPAAGGRDNPTPKFEPFTTTTKDTIAFATNQVDNDKHMLLLTPQQSLNPGVYALAPSSGDPFLFGVALGDVPATRSPQYGCVDINKQGGALQPCSVWDKQFKDKFAAALASHDQAAIQRLALPFIFLADVGDDVGDGGTVKALLDIGADVNTVTRMYPTSLIEATVNGCNEELVDYLIKHGATFDANARVDYTGRTLLETASGCGLTKLVGILLDKGADINKYNCCGETPLTAAVKPNPNRSVWKHQGNSDMVTLLLDHGANTAGKTGSGWICLGNGLISNPSNGITALHRAVSCGYVESAEILLSHGADIEAKGDSGHTPMHAAAAGGNLDAIQLLIDHHANINATDNKGESPLALAHKHPEAVKLLTANGAH